MMKQTLNNLLWIEDLLPPGYEAAPKHGGMAYYLDMKLVLILVEHREATHEHKGVTYPFELWNGCILPVEQIKQSAFFLKYSFLENHPVNKNWLYIPADSENFEDEVQQYLREIVKRNPLLGTPVKFSGPPKVKDPAAPVRKKAPTKVKADKKRENALFLSMLNKRIK
jgi:hypothetical protein